MYQLSRTPKLSTSLQNTRGPQNLRASWLVLAATLSITAPNLSADTSLAAAVLPTSRSVQVGDTATLFATIINAGSEAGSNCRIEAPEGLDADVLYQTTDPLNNETVGTANTPVAIAAGASQSFVFAITPNSASVPSETKMGFVCDNAPDVATIEGVNTFTFSASATPIADVVALGLTASGDGVVAVPSTTNIAAFSVASVNLGASDTLRVRAQSTNPALPVSLSLCETNSETGACINPVVPTTDDVIVSISSDATPTFGVFVTTEGDVDFSPGLNRISVSFVDDTDAVRGSTSVAIRSEDVLEIASEALIGSTLWGVQVREGRVDWNAAGVQFSGDNTGVSYENSLFAGQAVEEVAQPFVWSLDNGVLTQTFSNNSTITLAFDAFDFLFIVEQFGFSENVVEFVRERVLNNTLVGPLEVRENLITRVSEASALNAGRYDLSTVDSVNYSIDEVLINNGWPDPLPRTDLTAEPAVMRVLTPVGLVEQAIGQTAVAGQVWAVPFPYQPLDPLVVDSEEGYFTDTLELLADGTTTPGRLSQRSFNWVNEGNTLVLSDGDERHEITTIALVGDERQALIEYSVANELVLLTGLRVALGDNTGDTLAADFPEDLSATTPSIWQAGINTWREAAYAADGRLLVSEVFGYRFPTTTTSNRVFGMLASDFACPTELADCFTTDADFFTWSWSSEGNLISRSVAQGSTTRTRVWEVLSYEVGGRAVVLESAVWTFGDGTSSFVITPRLNTLELLDLGTYPEELANSPDL